MSEINVMVAQEGEEESQILLVIREGKDVVEVKMARKTASQLVQHLVRALEAS